MATLKVKSFSSQTTNLLKSLSNERANRGLNSKVVRACVCVYVLINCELYLIIEEHSSDVISRPVDPTVRWWNRRDLCALEKLWALTLKSALSSRGGAQVEWGSVVPDLPMASSAVVG